MNVVVCVKALAARIGAVVLCVIACDFAMPSAAPAQADRADLGKPELVIAAGDLSPGQRNALLSCARRFYRFWNTGDPDLLRLAISRHFVDHTLPPGREQGPEGPAAAAQTFLGAVPDLRVVVAQQIIAGDRVVSHLHFTGHFTGRFGTAVGQGQPIDFVATDILAVRDGRITDNWHIEDNLTFRQQIGIVPR
jgi:predicted ester cyclase